MKGLHLKRILGAVILTTVVAGIFVSCKKDLEINAPYQRYPIVIGLLNQYDSIQKIRITRSFLGTSNPNSYAKVPDSSYFDNVNVDLVLYENGFETQRYRLEEQEVNNKDSGTFYYPNQRVYAAATPEEKGSAGETTLKYLKEHSYAGNEIVNRIEYKLEGTVGSGTKISSKLTPIAEVSEKDGPIFRQTAYRSKWRTNARKGSIAFATSGSLTNGLQMTTNLPPLTKIAELVLIFNYKDIMLDGTEVDQQITESMGIRVLSTVSEFNTSEYDFYLSSERFFEIIARRVPDFDASTMKQRIPGIVDFDIIIGDNEYYNYRNNSLPSNDLNQTPPEYTNIENGFGVFGGRLKMRMTTWAIGTQDDIVSIDGMPGLLLDKWTQVALNQGYVESTQTGVIKELGTASKGFCTMQDVAGSLPSNCQ